MTNDEEKTELRVCMDAILLGECLVQVSRMCDYLHEQRRAGVISGIAKLDVGYVSSSVEVLEESIGDTFQVEGEKVSIRCADALTLRLLLIRYVNILNVVPKKCTLSLITELKYISSAEHVGNLASRLGKAIDEAVDCKEGDEAEDHE